jgi:hypothetical protein
MQARKPKKWEAAGYSSSDDGSSSLQMPSELNDIQMNSPRVNYILAQEEEAKAEEVQNPEQLP